VDIQGRMGGSSGTSSSQLPLSSMIPHRCKGLTMPCQEPDVSLQRVPLAITDLRYEQTSGLATPYPTTRASRSHNKAGPLSVIMGEHPRHYKPLPLLA